MNRMVAVQDCGLVINPRTAESQVYGALHHEHLRGSDGGADPDRITGRVLNADMEFYKLAGHRRHRRDHRAHGDRRRRTTSAA